MNESDGVNETSVSHSSQKVSWSCGGKNTENVAPANQRQGEGKN